MISYAEQEHFALVSRQSCDTKAKTLRPQPEWQVRCIRSSVNPLMLCNRAAKRYAGYFDYRKTSFALVPHFCMMD